MSADRAAAGPDLPLGRDVDVLARDRHGVVALNKPAGLLSHPNEPADEPRSLLIAHYHAEGEFYEWRDGERRARFWLLNRLDSATSGVILGATDEQRAKDIRAHFRTKSVQKTYVALAFGAMRAREEAWSDLLAVEKRGGQIRTASRAGNIPSVSHATSLQHRQTADGTLTLIKLEPRTGRSHQLRVQCAKRHLPIVGDQTYGDFTRNRTFAKRTGLKRLFLHSARTTFEYVVAGEKHVFIAEAPIPEEFRRAMG